MIQIGIDTSVLIGLLDAKDLWHKPAIALKETLVENAADIAILDCVLAEAISTIARRIHEKRRTSDLDELLVRIARDYPIDDILWVLPDVPILYAEIIDLVRITDGALNFNDALIALSCRYREIPFIASFDRDFDQVEWLQRIAEPDDLA